MCAEADHSSRHETIRKFYAEATFEPTYFAQRRGATDVAAHRVITNSWTGLENRACYCTSLSFW